MTLQEMQARAREEFKTKFVEYYDDYKPYLITYKDTESNAAEDVFSFLDSLIARVRTETLEEIQEWIDERKTAHGRAHGSIDCTQCAYDDIAAHLRALRDLKTNV